MSFGLREYLQHIADEAAFLERATAGVSREAFPEDPTLQRASVRSFEIIVLVCVNIVQRLWWARRTL